MVIVDNILDQEGDFLLVKTAGATTGIISINSFTEDVQGEVSGNLQREFRYTTDGINWIDWQDLTNGNLQAITVNPKHDFDIEYRFTKTDSVGSITWNWINLDCLKEDKECGTYFKQSPFSFFFECCTDEEILSWCVNVLEKIYRTGIVSKSLIRGLNNNESDEDRDYIDLWRSIACNYAMIVAYARKFQDFQNHQYILEKYLENRDLYLHNDNDLSDLQGLMTGYHREISKRGTLGGLDEMKRMISFNEVRDEFIVSITSHNTIGWTVNRHSPLYRGVQNNPSMNKMITILNGQINYPTIGTVVTDAEMHSISVINGDKAGLGMINHAFTDGFNVDSNLTYQLKMLIRVSDLTAKLSVYIHGWNAAGVKLDPQLTNIGQGGNAVDKLTLPVVNEWFELAVIIYPHTEPFTTDENITKGSLGQSNVKMVSQNSRIFADILVDDENSDSAGTIDIKDIQLSLISTPYSKGFVGGQMIQESFIKNNSGRYDQQEIEETIRKHAHYGAGVVNTYL